MLIQNKLYYKLYNNFLCAFLWEIPNKIIIQL